MRLTYSEQNSEYVVTVDGTEDEESLYDIEEHVLVY